MNLWRHLGCSTERGIIEDGEIFFDGAASRIRGGRQPRGTFDAGAVAGVGLDQAGVDGKPSPPTRPSSMQRCNGLEQPPQQIAVAEPAMPVLREGRMIGHFAVETQSTKPAIRQVEVHLLAQPPLRADAEAVADD
jgi:hypothetical protein